MEQVLDNDKAVPVAKKPATNAMKKPAAAGKVMKKPSKKEVVVGKTGCSKCRFSKGCIQCKSWARSGHGPYIFNEDGAVVRIG